MPFNPEQTLSIIEEMEIFIESIRPPEKIRNQIDIIYKIEDLSIILFELRPFFNKPDVQQEIPVAKATFIKSKNHWKIFWQRADLNWYNYEPTPTVKSVKEFTKLIIEDKNSCFWG